MKAAILFKYYSLNCGKYGLLKANSSSVRARISRRSSADIVQFTFRNIQQLLEFRSGSLYAVAQACDHDFRRSFLHGTAEHRHGVGIVQKSSIWTIQTNVSQDVQHYRDRAQEAEYAGHVMCIAYVDAD